ncbi:MAG: serine--tRNA ligase, partial [Mariniphaga sp.]
MLNLKFIQDYPEVVIEKLRKKNFDAAEIVGSIVDLYQQKNAAQQKVEQAKAEMNRISREIGQLFRDGKTEEADVAKARTLELKETIRELDIRFVEIEKKVMELQILLPNLPHESVPAGKGEEDNLVVKSGGEMPQLPGN